MRNFAPMPIALKRSDLGGDILSILTRGMYPDPKDALREYVQNGVDANTKKIEIKIRRDSIVIEDWGSGMSHAALRNAIRLGVSEKNPAAKVGFMGIGVYSAFHLCDKLTIFSKEKDGSPNSLIMEFGSMRLRLEEKMSERFAGNKESFIDLQSLMSNDIDLSEDGTMPDEEFPHRGTRVELEGVAQEFYDALSNFDEVAEYLRNVVPLHFLGEDKFSYGKEIEEWIEEKSKRDQKFRLIDLKLQVDEKEDNLFRPYEDSKFDRSGEKPQPPQFEIIENGEFFGIAWGCMNSTRNIIDDASLRGFIIKKRGFSVGDRETLMSFFPYKQTYFRRYSGEFIVLNDRLLTNAARTYFEYSALRNDFEKSVIDVATKFDDAGIEFQEKSKAAEKLSEFKATIERALAEYNERESDPNVILEKIIPIKKILNDLKKLKKRGYANANALGRIEKNATELQGLLQDRLSALADQKKKQKGKRHSVIKIAKNLSQLQLEQTAPPTKFDSLVELIRDYLEIPLEEPLVEIISLIDSRFVKSAASDADTYARILNELKDELLDDES